MKTNPIWIALGIGAALAVAANAFGFFAPSTFVALPGAGGRRQWGPGELAKLRAVLGAETAVPHPTEVAVWVVAPAGAAGGQNALALVKAIQGRGNIALTTENLYDSGAARGISEVTPAAWATMAGAGVAALPAL